MSTFPKEENIIFSKQNETRSSKPHLYRYDLDYECDNVIHGNKKIYFDTPLLGWLFIFVLVWINFLTITYKRKIEKINKIKEFKFFS